MPNLKPAVTKTGWVYSWRNVAWKNRQKFHKAGFAFPKKNYLKITWNESVISNVQIKPFSYLYR